jgi:nucleoside-triphosphatase
MVLRIVLTGKPSSGKSTLAMRTVELAREKDIKVVGIVTPEVRIHGRRVGFDMVSLKDGKRIEFARVGFKAGCMHGKYGINVSAAQQMFAEVTASLNDAELVVIDEVGPMELKCEGFTGLLQKVMASGKPAILVVHSKLACNYKTVGTVVDCTDNRAEALHKLVQFLSVLKR